MSTRTTMEIDRKQEQAQDLQAPDRKGSSASYQDAELARAEHILRLVAADPHPGQAVSQHLDEILGLLPALLTANIRQACREGNADLVHSLEVLLEEYQPLLMAGAQGIQEEDPWLSAASLDKSRVLFLSPDQDTSGFWGSFAAAALDKSGCQTTIAAEFPVESIKEFDVVIVSRPHLDPEYLMGMALCRACNIPLILHIDLDYRAIPIKHPEYERLSLAGKDKAQAFTTALLLADQIISPSRELVNQLREEGYTSFYAPTGWNHGNPLWSKPAPDRHTINIGWLGGPGQAEDLALIRRMLTRLMRQVPQTRLVIGSNPAAYHLFKNISDSRKLYLPPSREADFPFSLSQVDILIAPLRNHPYNRSLPDQPLMEAGARGIPWLASPLPSFLDWKEGGLFARNLDEWYTQLHQLVINPELRRELGQAGHQKSLEREIGQLAPVYKDLIDLIRWSKNTPDRTNQQSPDDTGTVSRESQ